MSSSTRTQPRTRARPKLAIKRVYDPPAPTDGARLLVDRLWPRGLKKQEARLDGWLKDVAPSDELRRWFGHDPARWREFVRRYEAELDARPEAWRPILERARRERLTLVYGARDTEHNQARVLLGYLQRRLRASGAARPRAKRSPGTGARRSTRG